MFKNISDIFFTTILGKLFGFIKIVLLINLYGTSSITDALIVVVSIYWFWSKIIVYSLFSISLIPDISKSNKEEEHINLVIDTIKSVNLISFIAFLLFSCLGNYIIYLFAPIQDEDFIKQSYTLLFLLSPLLFLIPTTEIFTIFNQYKNKMRIASVNLTVWNILQIIGIILSFYVFESTNTLVYLFAISSVIGYFITSLIQINSTNFFKYFSISSLFGFSLSKTIKIIRQNIVFFTATLFTQLNLYIDNFFVSQLDSGSISKYNIIIKVPELAQSLLISSLSVVFFNLITKDENRIDEIFKKFSFNLLPFICLGLVLAFFFGVGFLNLIYGKQAFAGTSDQTIRMILIVIIINIFFMVGVSLLVKIFVTLKKTKVLLIASIINVCVNVIANYYLIEEFHIYGVSLATLLATYILFSILISVNFKFNTFKNILLIIGILIIIFLIKIQL